MGLSPSWCYWSVRKAGVDGEDEDAVNRRWGGGEWAVATRFFVCLAIARW